jgi:hypothetical protein
MENRIFEGAEAAVANIRFEGPFDESTLTAIEEADDVFAVSMIRLED